MAPSFELINDHIRNMDLNQKQLQLVTWAQTGVISVLMLLITAFAGFWASSVTKAQEKTNENLEKLTQAVNNNVQADVGQEKDIENALDRLKTHEEAIKLLWEKKQNKQ